MITIANDCSNQPRLHNVLSHCTVHYVGVDQPFTGYFSLLYQYSHSDIDVAYLEFHGHIQTLKNSSTFHSNIFAQNILADRRLFCIPSPLAKKYTPFYAVLAAKCHIQGSPFIVIASEKS